MENYWSAVEPGGCAV